MVRLVPPRLARFVTLALQARVHQDGAAPAAVGLPRAGPPDVALHLVPPQQVAAEAFPVAAEPRAAPGEARPRWRRYLTQVRHALGLRRRPPGKAYMFFEFDFRASHPALEVAEAIREAGIRWKAMSDRERSMWEKRSPAPAFPASNIVVDKKAMAEDKARIFILTEVASEALYELRAANPDASEDQLMKMAGEKWQTMTPEERDRCLLRAIRTFESLGGEVSHNITDDTDERRAYTIFEFAFRGSVNLEKSEATEKARELWGRLSYEEKLPFLQQAKPRPAHSDRDLAAIFKNVESSQRFLFDLRVANPGRNLSDVMKAASKIWATLDDEEKDFYENYGASQLEEAYKFYEFDVRGTHPQWSREKAVGAARAKWEKMTEEERAPYVLMAAPQRSVPGLGREVEEYEYINENTKAAFFDLMKAYPSMDVGKAKRMAGESWRMPEPGLAVDGFRSPPELRTKSAK